MQLENDRKENDCLVGTHSPLPWLWGEECINVPSKLFRMCRVRITSPTLPLDLTSPKITKVLKLLGCQFLCHLWTCPSLPNRCYERQRLLFWQEDDPGNQQLEFFKGRWGLLSIHPQVGCSPQKWSAKQKPNWQVNAGKDSSSILLGAGKTFSWTTLKIETPGKRSWIIIQHTIKQALNQRSFCWFKNIHPQSLTARPWKMVVGRRSAFPIGSR